MSLCCLPRQCKAEFSTCKEEFARATEQIAQLTQHVQKIEHERTLDLEQNKHKVIFTGVMNLAFIDVLVPYHPYLKGGGGLGTYFEHDGVSTVCF